MQLIIALKEFHNMGKIYKDLRLENILIDSKGDCHLSNYGYSWAKINNDTKIYGAMEYLAPEVLHKKQFSHLSDIWAMGIVIYEVMMGVTPFNHQNQTVLSKFITQLDLHIPEKLTLSDEGKDFLTKILKKSPESRLGFSGIKELMDHEWFKGIDWENVNPKSLPSPIKVRINPNNMFSNFKTERDYKVRSEDNSLKTK